MAGTVKRINIKHILFIENVSRNIDIKKYSFKYILY